MDLSTASTVGVIFMTIFTSIVGFLVWTVKKYINKVDDLDIRVTKIETVLNMLGDIRKDLSSVKTDVEVIKTKVEKV